MPSLYHLSSVPRSVLSLLLLLLAAIGLPATEAVELSPPRILDLSQDFPDGNTYNTDTVGFEENMTPDVLRFIVIEDGEVVKEYQGEGVEDDYIYNLFSVTKSVMSVIIGTILYSDEYNLSMDDTLGDIFIGEDDWSAMEDLDEVEFKQNITIYELMTMTSGLTLNTNIDILDTPNSAGTNLKRSLASPGWNPKLKGKGEYLAINNILSYVVVAVTGMTPKEYASVDLFPSLGIDVERIRWDTNQDRVEASFSDLHMTGRDMAKFAQLYLQKGKSAPDKQLVPEEFVQESLTEQTSVLEEQRFGLLWFFVDFNFLIVRNPIGDGMWCGMGLQGQGFCFNYESKRVVVYQRRNTVRDILNWFNLIRLSMTAFSADLTWNTTVVANDNESDPSGALSLSASSALVPVATIMSCFAFWL